MTPRFTPSWTGSRALFAGFVFTAVAVTLAQAGSWQKVVTPRFTLITDASDYQSRRLLTDFSDYLIYLDKAMAMSPKDLKPLTLVLFDSQKEYETYEARLSNGQTVETVATERELFGGSTTGAGANWAAMAAVAEDQREGTRRVVFSGGVKWYLDSLEQPMPLAVERGLSAVFAHFRRGVDHGIEGQPIPELAGPLQNWPMVPVERLLQDNDMEGIVRRNELVEYSAESWALMHYLMFAKAPMEHGAFSKFWLTLRNGQTPHEALVVALGTEGAAGIDLSLRTYLHGMRYVVKVPMGEEKDNHDPYQPATELEVQEALTKAAMIAGRNSMALSHADAAVAAAQGNPEPYDLRAELLARMPDQADGRRAAIQQAIAHGSKSGYTLWSAAYYQWIDAGEASATPQAARLVVNAAERAANADLSFQPAYDLLAQSLQYADHVTDADVQFLLYGRRQFVRDRWMLVGLTAFAQKRGKLSDAAAYKVAALSTDPALDPQQRAEVAAYVSQGKLPAAGPAGITLQGTAGVSPIVPP